MTRIVADRQDLLQRLHQEILACRLCDLHKTRTQAVPGTGPLEAEMMFVGEAPGRDEDLQGEPFVGQAGQLLTQCMEKAGIDRSRVFIANVLKCRPLDNRDPEATEVEACRPYLDAQIALVAPKVVCLLGNHALHFFLGPGLKISEARGRVHRKNGLRFFPTFHPAAALHGGGPRIAAQIVADLKNMRRLLEEEG